MLSSDAVPIERVRVSTFVVPTDGKESDGTLEWDSTTMVVTETTAGGRTGLGWTYADKATAQVIDEKLADAIQGRDATAIPALHARMTERVRNLGRPGVASMAMSAVDASLWDLKAKLLDVPLVTLLGMRRPCVPAYASGGFTSYSDEQLRAQLAAWCAQGFTRLKMKVGRQPGRDVHRVQTVRELVGPQPQLFVDANGAYTRQQALELARMFHALGVVWFEEPVSSDDLEGLHMLRERVPPGMDVAAGEYGYDLHYFRHMLAAGAVDVLQADATRCTFSGFLRVDALCEAFSTPLSAHCAPSLHLHAACASQRLEHIEYFHDHVRLESMLLDGAAVPRMGVLAPDLSRPGLGVELKRADAERFAA